MLIIVGIIVLVLDQLSKIYIQSHMTVGQSVPVVQNVFHITYVLNPGAAFGIMQDMTFLLVGIVVVMLVALACFYKLLNQQGWLIRCSIGLILGGAIGNVIDRLQTGLVVDFLDFRIWPVFNIADIGICVGAGLIILDILLGREE